MVFEVYTDFTNGDNFRFSNQSDQKVTYFLYNLIPNLFKIEIIDIINESLECFNNYNQEIKQSLYENFNIVNEKEWKQTQKNLVTVSKKVKLHLDFNEYQHEVTIKQIFF